MNAARLDQASDPKAFGHLAALLALNGWHLWRSDPADGVQRFFVGRWNVVQVLASLDEVERFLERSTAA